jgi:hypothetical protein
VRPWPPQPVVILGLTLFGVLYFFGAIRGPVQLPARTMQGLIGLEMAVVRIEVNAVREWEITEVRPSDITCRPHLTLGRGRSGDRKYTLMQGEESYCV